MERPERPSRHKSNPVKFPIRPSFSSDSESELNDNDVPIQITYYQHPPESASNTGGPSTSSTVDANQSSAETSSNMMRVSPIPVRVTLSPIAIPSREEEPRTDQSQESGRRKRSAATLSASSAAASVIFDSVDSLIADSLIAHNSSSRAVDSPERPLERFQHSDYVIRPRSFCNIDYSNAIRPPVYKIKRPNGPIDLTPSTSNRDSSCQAPVVTSSFSLRDNSTLPTTTETTQINYYNNRSSGATPYIISPSGDHQSSNSSILRRFDELCSSSPVIRRRSRAYSVRFLEGGRYNEGSHTDVVNSNPLITRNSSSLDDYCDIVGNFLFNYPSPLNNSDNQRSQLPPERTAVADPHSSTTANIINRHINNISELDNHEPSIIGEINSYLNSTEVTRNDIDNTGEAMDVPNDDVIVVETTEQPPLPGSPDPNMVPSPLPGSPDPDLVPSSRSPSPMPLSTPNNSAHNMQEKAQSICCGEVPMTLQELNQTLVSLLECPVCLDHATPPIYQCCKGHILCQNCHPRLSTCPICRSRLPGDRNSAMEKVAEKLMYPCKNTVTGCSMMLKLDDKQEHEEGCGFRHYACIVTSCHWKGYKPELVVHLQSNHPDKLINGTSKEVQVPLAVPVGGTAMFIAHHWIQSAHNEVFNVIFHIDLYKRIMKGCVIYIGPPDKAEKFTYLFELKQRVPPFRKLTYSRTTHADTLKPGQPLCLNNDFSINIDMARLYRPTDCTSQNIPIFITILQVE